MKKPTGVQFEISVDGKPRSYRDRTAIAIEAAEYLKWKHPHSEVVVANVADPVGAGWVQSLVRPAGNATGFTNFEYSLGGKWLEILKQMAPGITRAAVLRSATSVAANRPIRCNPVGAARARDRADAGRRA